ncbi:MAG: hypothetical protein ACR2LX_01870 [Jatrophihabitans sp.]
MSRFVTITRIFGMTNAVIGLFTAMRPDIAARLAGGQSGRPTHRRIVQVLGARQAVQGLVTAARPHPDVLVLGAAVDLLQALSMLPVAAVLTDSRRPALTSASMAALSATAGAAIVATSEPS